MVDVSLGVLLFFTVATKATKDVTTNCDDLRCENQSPCRTTVSHDIGGRGDRAECYCQGKWTGQRCELEIVLGVTDVREDSVRLEIRTRSSNNVIQVSTPQSKYTLMYWSNSTEHSCLLVQEVTSSVHIIDGLTSDLHYTFCSRTGIVDFCEVTRFDFSLPSNCIIVQTLPASSASSNTRFGTLGVSLVVIFSLLIIIVVLGIIFLKKKNRLSIAVALSLCHCHMCDQEKTKSAKSSPSIQSRVLLSSQSPIFIPSGRAELSPSTVNSRLAKRAKTYGAKCEPKQTLTTLIEDSEDIGMVGETSLSKPLTQ